MTLSTQAKMLRVLQERSFERVDRRGKVKVNVRVICATNHNLEHAVKSGKFRLGLFYRINLFVIETPSLRERACRLAQDRQDRCRNPGSLWRSGAARAANSADAGR